MTQSDEDLVASGIQSPEFPEHGSPRHGIYTHHSPKRSRNVSPQKHYHVVKMRQVDFSELPSPREIQSSAFKSRTNPISQPRMVNSQTKRLDTQESSAEKPL